MFCWVLHNWVLHERFISFNLFLFLSSQTEGKLRTKVYSINREDSGRRLESTQEIVEEYRHSKETIGEQKKLELKPQAKEKGS